LVAVGLVDGILDEIRAELAPSEDVLGAARDRRKRVLAAARGYPGVLRTFSSGSIAHGTANGDTDADCGVVLDRRIYQELGPDGDGVGPGDPVEALRAFLREELGEEGGIEFGLTKRAIKVTFDEPIDGQDPSVDLIVGLERRDAPGIWIPNLERARWDPSHPQKHTELFISRPRSVRRVWARSTRLAKGWNKQFSQPAVCSFNVEVFVWRVVEDGMRLSDALQELFSHGAAELKERNTPDPAGVSKPIKTLIERKQAAGRLERAAALMAEALEGDGDEETVRAALAKLFPDYVKPPGASASKAGFADALRRGNAGLTIGAGGLEVGGRGVELRPTRAFGDVEEK
jgi:hypothetical protein